MESSQLFVEGVPTTFGQVISTVVGIFASEWKTFLSLSAISLLTYGVMAIIFSIATFIFFAREIEYLTVLLAGAAANGGSYDVSSYYDGGRRLLEHVTGITGLSRFLEQGYYYGNDYYGNNEDGDVNQYYSDMDGFNIGFTPFALLIMILLFALAGSIFNGAMTHAAAEYYAGAQSMVKKSLQYGWSKKLSIFSYQAIVGFAGFIIFFLSFSISLGLSKTDFFLTLVITGLFDTAIIGIVTTLLVASVPAIVVEKKSSIQAIKRSIELCKGHFCFIFMAMIGFNAIIFGVQQLASLFLGFLPDSIAFFGLILMNTVILAFNPM